MFHPRPLLSLAVVVFLGGSAVAGCGRKDASRSESTDFGPGHARPRLITEAGSITPGKAFDLGVTFDIEPEWHLYWNGLNDTGYPIHVDPVLPAGFRADTLLWPAPERRTSPGNILDHVYSGRVTLLLPVHPPADLTPGTQATFTCRLDWLACREACIPGADTVSLTLPVGTPGPPRSGLADANIRARFRETRERLPEPAARPPAGVNWRWVNGALVIKTHGTGTLLAFYPTPNSVPIPHLLEEGVSQTGTLTLHPDENPGTTTALSGVLEVNPGPPGKSRFYSISVPLEASQRR